MAKIEKFLEEDLVFAERPKRSDFQDLTGQKFGRLKVLGFAGNRHWFCRCECQNVTKIQRCNLKNGHTKSCGCFNIERIKETQTTHGNTANGNMSLTYNTWKNMLARCQNHENPYFSDYGGRGIKVCERWQKSFENFLEDMGERPNGLTLERNDNELGYYKENCRWATQIEQANNRRSNRILTFKEKTQTMTQWSVETGISPATLSYRINNGWAVERALTLPTK